MEEWKQSDEFSNYEISNKGGVRSVKTGRILKPQTNKSGYPVICLREGGRQYTKKIARLVGDAFIESDDKDLPITYRDGDRTNVDVDNLEYCTTKEISRRAFETGRRNSNHRKKAVVDADTGDIYESITECSEVTGISKAAISRTASYRGFQTSEGRRFVPAEDF